ncbi:unnamed protein product [Staurois parvus]|uniref:CRIB domain-containing protein n=1 Tax=Staurois parvus TaxID=386267 RepID=A0ABN9GQ89_9NEOB|nr:unnamed protein product [Staurois parvus]
MPILKQSSSHSKKRTRIDREMISAPLGDFRHTMHVGRGGDVFGDTSFLSNHGPASAPPVEVPAAKKSHSDQVDWLPLDCGLKHAESMLSFHLDLGPSILDDVLGVMDRDAHTADWNSPDDQCDYKFSADSSKLAQLSSITESPGSHYSLSTTLPITNPSLDYNASDISENLEGNRSAYEGDSEEEKRSIYEGVADSPAQNNSFHTSHCEVLDDDDERRRRRRKLAKDIHLKMIWMMRLAYRSINYNT